VKVRREDRRIGEPPVQLADIALVLAPSFVHLGPRLLPELDVDADLAGHALDQGRYLLVAVVRAEHPDELQALAVLHADAVRAGLPAGVVQELLRARGVVREQLGRQRREPGGGRLQQRGRRLALPVEHDADDGVLADRELQGAAHGGIIRGDLRHVRIDRPRRARRHAAEDSHVGVALERRHIGVGEILGDVDLARLEHGGACRRLRYETPHDLVDVGGAAMLGRGRRPVVGGIPDQGDVALGHPFLDHEGPGADRLEAEVLARLLRGGRRDGAERRERRHAQEGRVGLLEPDAHALGIDHVGALVRAEERPGHPGRPEWFLDPIKGELHRCSIERSPVVKLHVLAQPECVALAVTRDIPRFGEAGQN
jgi:hypothetical protein